MTTTFLADQVLDFLSMDKTDTANRVMALSGLNAARKSAEIQHDWSTSRVDGYLSIASDEQALTPFPNDDLTGTQFEVKQLLSCVAINSDGTESVLVVRSNALQQKLQTRQDGLLIPDPYPRDNSPNVTQPQPWTLGFCLIINGPKIKPSYALDPAMLIRVECFQWLNDYSTDSDTDFFLTHGWEYLMWYAVCYVNTMVQKFAYRQEGTLPPPEKMRDMAFEKLVNFDIYRNNEHNDHNIITP